MSVKYDKILADIEALTVKFVDAKHYDYLTVISRIRDQVVELVSVGDSTASSDTVSATSASS